MITTRHPKRKFKYKITLEQAYTHEFTHQVRLWCNAVFGASGHSNVWRFGWTEQSGAYYFQNEKDAVFFTLRWA